MLLESLNIPLMTVDSTAQPTETHGKLAGIFPLMKSFIVDQATHTLRSAAILFLRDRGEGTQSTLCFCTPVILTMKWSQT